MSSTHTPDQELDTPCLRPRERAGSNQIAKGTRGVPQDAPNADACLPPPRVAPPPPPHPPTGAGDCVWHAQRPAHAGDVSPGAGRVEAGAGEPGSGSANALEQGECQEASPQQEPVVCLEGGGSVRGGLRRKRGQRPGRHRGVQEDRRTASPAHARCHVSKGVRPACLFAHPDLFLRTMAWLNKTKTMAAAPDPGHQLRPLSFGCAVCEGGAPADAVAPPLPAMFGSMLRARARGSHGLQSLP